MHTTDMVDYTDMTAQELLQGLPESMAEGVRQHYEALNT